MATSVLNGPTPILHREVLDGFENPELGCSGTLGERQVWHSIQIPTMNGLDDLRQMSLSELEQLGQDSLRDHLSAQAIVAHQKYAPLTADKLETFLNDPETVRHPTRLVFEFGEMALHQFAQPDVDWRRTEENGRVLYVRPMLKDRPELLPLAVAYMVPLINYGEIITDDHCLRYGATLLGQTEDEFYAAICDLADAVGAEPRPSCSAGHSNAEPFDGGCGA